MKNTKLNYVMVLRIGSIKDYNEALSPFLEYHLTKYATEKDIWKLTIYTHRDINTLKCHRMFSLFSTLNFLQKKKTLHHFYEPWQKMSKGALIEAVRFRSW